MSYRPKQTYFLGCQDALVGLWVSGDGEMVPIVTSHDVVGGTPCWRVRGIEISHCQPLYLMAHFVLRHPSLILWGEKGGTQLDQSRARNDPSGQTSQHSSSWEASVTAGKPHGLFTRLDP